MPGGPDQAQMPVQDNDRQQALGRQQDVNVREQEENEEQEEENIPVINNDAGGRQERHDGNEDGREGNGHVNDDNANDENDAHVGGNGAPGAPGGGGDGVEGGQGARGNVPETRFEVLKRKLVDDHAAAKNQRNDAALDDNTGITHSGGGNHLKRIDKAAEYLSLGGKVGAAATSLGPAAVEYGARGISAASKIGGGEGWDGGSNFADSMNNSQAFKDVTSVAAMASHTASAAGAALKMGSNSYKAVNDKNKNKRKTARYKAVSGALGTVGSGSKALSSASNLGLFGKRSSVAGSWQQKTAGALDIAGGVASAGAGAADLFGNISDKRSHSKTARNAREIAGGGGLDGNLRTSREAIDRLKGDGQLDEEQTNTLRAARKARHTAKAQKYAMKQAADMHEQKAKGLPPGIVGAISGAVGGLGSILTGVAKITGNAGGLLGTIGKFISLGATVGGLAATAVDKIKGRKKAKEMGRKRNEVVDEYLGEKIAKIRHEANELRLTDRDRTSLGERGKDLTETEAKKIALLRLGVNIDSDAQSISDANYTQAFDKITEKRANNILHSSAAEKSRMLEALGLDEDAAFEDVAAALKAN